MGVLPMLTIRRSNAFTSTPIFTTSLVPEEVLSILDTLEANGFKSYLVGGAVRDAILGEVPHDWDIATSATPEQVESIFNTYPSGKKFGIVTVITSNSTLYEVATLRKESDYSDGRHPDKIEFVTNIEEDLSRRDLTINALAWNPREGLIDLFDGVSDLKANTIKFVGSPEKRILEDRLRILRAIRFASKYGASIEHNSLEAIKHNPSLSGLSSERIRDELFKILETPKPSVGLSLLAQTGVLQNVSIELADMQGYEQNNPHHCYDLFYHTIYSIDNATNYLPIRLTMLLHDIGKLSTRAVDQDGVHHFNKHADYSVIFAKDLLQKLRVSKTLTTLVLKLVQYHDVSLPTKKSIRKVLLTFTSNEFKLLLEVRRADILAQHKQTISDKLLALGETSKLFHEILEEESAISLRDLAINGNDLLSLGYKGKTIGKILEKLLDIVQEDPSLNTRESLLNRIEVD